VYAGENLLTSLFISYPIDNEEKDEFMKTAFAGTSLLWAYNIINSRAGAAKADIWRYAVLWAYGGAYIDDDR